jgi:hypothetical protein
VQTDALHCRLQGETVHHRREHAHVIGCGAIHTALGSRLATPDVATADNNAHFDATRRDGGHLSGNRLQHAEVDMRGSRTLEGLPA